MYIETERLWIRALEPEDWKGLQAIAADFIRSPYAIYDQPLPTQDDAIQALTKQFADSGMWFVVTLPDSHEIIGYICFHLHKGSYDLGYCFHSAYQGKGYAYESCSALMAHLEQRGAESFTAGTALKNLPSRKLLERLGFALAGTEVVCFQKDMAFEGGRFVKRSWRTETDDL